MQGMPPERKERWLLTLIGASIVLIVLAIAYLTYRTLPDKHPEATVLPATISAPESTVPPPAVRSVGTDGSPTPDQEQQSEPAQPTVEGSPSEDASS